MELSFEIIAKYDQLVKMQSKLAQFNDEYNRVYKELATTNVAPLMFKSIQNDIDKTSESIKTLVPNIINAVKSINSSSASDLQILSGNTSDALKAIGAAATEQRSKLDDFFGSIDSLSARLGTLGEGVGRVSGAISSINSATSKMDYINAKISATTDPTKLASYNLELSKCSDGIADYANKLSDWNTIQVNAGEIASDVAQKQSQLSAIIANQEQYVDSLKQQVIQLGQQWLAASGTKKLELWDKKSSAEDMLAKEIANLDTMKLKANEIKIAFDSVDQELGRVFQNIGQTLTSVGNVKIGEGIRQSFEDFHVKAVVARDSLSLYNKELDNISIQSAKIMNLRDAIASLDAEAQSGAVSKLEAEMRSCSQSMDTSYASLAKMQVNTKAWDDASAAAAKTMEVLGSMISTQTEVVENHRTELERLENAYKNATDGNKASILSQKETVQSSLEEEQSTLTTMQNTLHSVQSDYEQMVVARQKISQGIVSADQKATQSQAEFKKQTSQTTEEQRKAAEEARKQSQAVNGLVGTWKQFLGTIGVAAGLKSFISQLIEVNARMEQMKTSLYGIMQNQTEADNLFNSIRGISSHSAIGLGSLVGVAQQFVAFGESSERIPKLLNAMNDVAMGSEQKFNRLASSLQMMAAMGQVNTRTIRSMITAGFNPLIAISKETGKSMAELRKEVKKGTIPVSDITNAFISATKEGGMFYKMNDKMSGTLSYQFAVMKKNVAAFFLELGKGSDGTMHSVTKMLVSLTKHLKEFAEAAKIIVVFAGIKTGAYLAAQAITALSTAMKVATGATIGLSTAMKASGWGTIISLAAAAGVAIYDFAQNTKESTGAIAEYNKAVNGATGDVERLFTTLENTDKSSKVHQDTLKELVDKYNEYGIHIDTSKGLLNDEVSITQHLIEKKEILIGLIRQEAAERAKAAQYEKYQKEKDDITDKSTSNLNKELEGRTATIGKNAGKSISKGMAQGLAVSIQEDIKSFVPIVEKASKKYLSAKELKSKYGKILKDTNAYNKSRDLDKYFYVKGVKFENNEGSIKQLELLQKVAKKSGISVKDMSRKMVESIAVANTELLQVSKNEQDFTETVNQNSEDLDFNALKLRYNKMGVEQLGTTIRNILTNYGENDINFRINVDDTQVPKWMKDLGLSSTQLSQNAAYWTAQLQDMKKKGIKVRYVKGKDGKYTAVTQKDAAERASQYQKSSEDKLAEEKRKDAKAEEDEKEEKKRERARQAAERKRQAAERKAIAKQNRIKDAQNNFNSTLSDSTTSLSSDKERKENDLKDDGIEKQMAEAELNYNEAVKSAQDHIKDVAKALYKLNKAKNGTSKSVEELQSEIMKASETDKTYGKLIKAYNSAIDLAGKELSKSHKDIFEGLRGEYDKDGFDRESKLKKLKADIKALEELEKKAKESGDDNKLANIQMLKDNAKEQFQWLRMSRESWVEYYTQYGTFLEKVNALNEKFKHDTQGMDVNSAQYKIQQKQLEKSVKDLEFDEIKKQLNWEDVFGDLSRLGKSALADLQKQLEAIIQNDKNLSVESIKTINEAINKVRAEQVKKGSLIGNMIGSFRDLKSKKNAADKANEQVQNVAGGSIWKRYKEAEESSDIRKKDEIRSESIFDPVNNKVVKFGELLDRAAKATKDYSEAQKTANETIKSVGGGFSALSQMGKEISGTLEKFGVNVPKGVDKIFDGLGSVGSSLEGFDLSHLGSFLDIRNYVHIFTGLAGGVADIFSGFISLFGHGSGEKAYRDELAHYEKLSGIWSDLISKKKEYVDMSFGDGAKKAIAEVEALYQAEEKSIKNVTRTFLNKRSFNAHSQRYRANEAIKNVGGFAKWSKLAGVDISSIDDLYAKDYSYDQLVALKGADNGEFWASLGTEMQDYLGKLIECKKGTEDFQQTALEKLTGVKFDDMYSNFMSALTDMSKGADDFVRDFKNNMLKALIENTMGRDVKAWMEDFTKRYQSAVDAEGGKLSEVTARTFQDELTEKSNEYFDKRNEIANNVGLGSADDNESQSKGYATASEDSIAELSGRALAQTEALYSIRDIQENYRANIESIQSDVKATRMAFEVSRELQENSYLELVEIRKNTFASSKALEGIKSDIARIRKKTDNI